MTDTKINSSFDFFRTQSSGDSSNSLTGLLTSTTGDLSAEIAAPFSAEQKRGFDHSALLKLKLQNRFQQTFAAQTANVQTETVERVFQTSGGAWRVKDGSGGASPNPEFYPNGANVSGTTLFDKQFYQYNGKWIELNANGRSSDLPENKNKPRPENVSEFDWQGWREVSASEIPADYSADGKTVAFENTDLAQNQKSAFKRYLVDCNLIKDWDEVLGERLIDAATQKGAKIELVPTGEVNADGKTVFRVKMSDESLAILRSEIKDYNHAIARDREAEEKGKQEATNDVADMFGAVYETGRKAVEAALNTPSAILNTVFQPAASCTDKTIPSYGRVKFGAMFDKSCEQMKGNHLDPFPKFDTSGIKYDFRSEWMRRDINGKVDGKGIKMGDATTTIAGAIAPIVVGKVITPVESPQSLKDLGGLPEVEMNIGSVENTPNPLSKVGKSEVEKGRDLSPSEKAFADKMAGEGKVIKAKKEVNIQGVKNPDFDIDGEIVEFKYVSDLKGTNADKLSGGLSRRILDGKSQASKVTINVENQIGMTEEIAKRAVDRAYGALKTQKNVNFKEVRIYGKNFDFTIPFKK